MSSRVLWKKIRMRAILKESTANYISLESLINVDFGRKKMNSHLFNSTKENCKKILKMTMRHSINQVN